MTGAARVTGALTGTGSRRRGPAPRSGRAGAGSRCRRPRRRRRGCRAGHALDVGRRAADRVAIVGRVDHERLSRLLGTPELAWVVDVPGPRSRGNSDTVSPTVITLPSSACRNVADDTGRLRLKLYSLAPVMLSDVVPALENFGFRVVEEVSTPFGLLEPDDWSRPSVLERHGSLWVAYPEKPSAVERTGIRERRILKGEGLGTHSGQITQVHGQGFVAQTGRIDRA